MMIHDFRFENKKWDMRIEPVRFSNLSLLVGASGVGKTLILRAISELAGIARGKSSDGAEWEIRFSANGGEICLWRGAFGQTETADLSEELSGSLTAAPGIIHEEVYLNDCLIIGRKENRITLKGKPAPRLSSHKSVLNLFEEECIASVSESFDRIISGGRSYPGETRIFKNFDAYLKKYSTLESIRNASAPVFLKLAMAYRNRPAVFSMIRDHFTDMFPQVREISLEPSDAGNMPRLGIREKNVSPWIFRNRISSGMFKALMQISQLFLCPEGAVILIDEFENSLGINCIDTLTGNLTDDKRKLQFIITSHHPYVINAVGMEHWKIVSRHGGTISARDAEEYRLGRSRHESFKQLIQLTDYRKGIKV